MKYSSRINNQNLEDYFGEEEMDTHIDQEAKETDDLSDYNLEQYKDD